MLPTYMTMVDYYGFVTQLWGGGGGEGGAVSATVTQLCLKLNLLFLR